MSAEQNVALARRFMEARVKGDVDALDEMLAFDFISHTKLLPEEGAASARSVPASLCSS